MRPTEGQILFNGQDISKQTVATLAKDIGLIFQNPNDQIFKNTVLDEVMFGPMQIGMSKDKAKEVALKALDMVGLKEQRRLIRMTWDSLSVRWYRSQRSLRWIQR